MYLGVFIFLKLTFFNLLEQLFQTSSTSTMLEQKVYYYKINPQPSQIMKMHPTQVGTRCRPAVGQGNNYKSLGHYLNPGWVL